MSGLRDFVQAGRTRLHWRVEEPIEPSRLRQTVAALRLRDQRDLSANDLGAVQNRLFHAFTQGALSYASRRDLREGAKGYLSAPRPPGRDKAMARALRAAIGEKQRRSPILALLGVYLSQFDQNDSDILDLAAWLKEGWAHWSFKQAALWAGRSWEMRLFDPEQAPQILAAKALSWAAPHAALAEAGLEGERAFGGLGEAAFSLACKMVLQSDTSNLTLLQQRLVQWGHQDNRFAYQKQWPLYARALVEPWGNDARDDKDALSDDHKAFLINELLAYAGDPRTGRTGKWSMLEASLAHRILLRWLTRASVLQFLDIVDKTADPGMWAYRRAFWMSYLLTNHIDSAWVAFGDNGARIAADLARRTKDEGLAQFGRVQRGTGRSADHAALIMKIGDLTIADWSHNGKYNIWHRGDRGAPELFLSEYNGYILSNAPTTGSHTGSATFLWQRRIAQEIADHTRRRVPSDQWQPKRRR